MNDLQGWLGETKNHTPNKLIQHLGMMLIWHLPLESCVGKNSSKHCNP